MGVEPTSGGTTILCLNRLATLAIIVMSYYNTSCSRDPVVLLKERTQLIWSLITTANSSYEK